MGVVDLAARSSDHRSDVEAYRHRAELSAAEVDHEFLLVAGPGIGAGNAAAAQSRGHHLGDLLRPGWFAVLPIKAIIEGKALALLNRMARPPIGDDVVQDLVFGGN